MKPETLPAIWTLIQVIELGILSAAAKTLGVTPSGVSKQISRLEAQLDTRLLHRTTRKINPTEEGIDLAIREGSLADSSLVATTLGEFRIMLCASPNYLARAGTPERLIDLERHDFVTVPIPGREMDLSRVRVPGKKRLDLKARIVVNDLFAVRELARQNRGIAPLPEYMLGEDLADGRLVRVLPENIWPSVPVTGLVPERRFQPNRVRALLDFLIEHFRESSDSKRID